MKVKLIGSHLCPDTLYALNRLYEAGIKVEFEDILSCHAVLRDYLEIRESSPLYEEIRGTRSLGIPCFVREDGSMTLNLDDILG